jgi:hypothetical protein
MDEDIKWLLDLHADLWLPCFQRGINLSASRVLTQVELDEAVRIIEARDLLTSMTSGMFGAYGMKIYTHPSFPGTPPAQVLLLVQGHIPGRSRYDVLRGAETPPKPAPGCGRDDAWKLFSKFTHSEQNRGWLKMYGMSAPRNQSYYDY